MKPAFLITIDTEGDNCWSRPRETTTANSRYLPRFQQLCETYRLKPTYLTNWEMAHCEEFQALARDALARGQAEIGMHLHAWNSPPLEPLTADDLKHQPYLIEYPQDVMRRKIDVLTKALEDIFGVPIRSHRAGRWSFNEVYARLLVEANYAVDCSVTPHVSWKTHLGNPNGNGGVDFSRFPETHYFPDALNLSRPGDLDLLEVPMTIVRPAYGAPVKVARRLARWIGPLDRVRARLWPEILWLRPNGRNGAQLRRVLEIARREGRDYVEFMLHSSEFMPGGSPTFPTAGSIDRLFADIESLFDDASRDFAGTTLGEYRDRCVARSRGLHAGTATPWPPGQPEINT